MPLLGPFNKNPPGIIQGTGIKGDLVMGPINLSASGIATGMLSIVNMPSALQATGTVFSLERFIVFMGT